MGHVKRSKRILVNMYTFGSENHLNAFFYFCKFVGLVNFYATIHYLQNCTNQYHLGVLLNYQNGIKLETIAFLT